MDKNAAQMCDAPNPPPRFWIARAALVATGTNCTLTSSLRRRGPATIETRIQVPRSQIDTGAPYLSTSSGETARQPFDEADRKSDANVEPDRGIGPN